MDLAMLIALLHFTLAGETITVIKRALN